MAAKATRFCLRTLRTKPLRVSGWSCDGDGRGGEGSKRAAIEGAVDDAVEEQRAGGRAGRVNGKGKGRQRGGGRRLAQARANNWHWLMGDGQTCKQRAGDGQRSSMHRRSVANRRARAGCWGAVPETTRLHVCFCASPLLLLRLSTSASALLHFCFCASPFLPPPSTVHRPPAVAVTV